MSHESAGTAPKVWGGGLGQEGRLLSGSSSASCGSSALDLLINCQLSVCVGTAESYGCFPVQCECLFPSSLRFIWVTNSRRGGEETEGSKNTVLSPLPHFINCPSDY